jgi:hypothetical protein
MGCEGPAKMTLIEALFDDRTTWKSRWNWLRALESATIDFRSFELALRIDFGPA